MPDRLRDFAAIFLALNTIAAFPLPSPRSVSKGQTVPLSTRSVAFGPNLRNRHRKRQVET